MCRPANIKIDNVVIWSDETTTQDTVASKDAKSLQMNILFWNIINILRVGMTKLAGRSHADMSVHNLCKYIVNIMKYKIQISNVVKQLNVNCLWGDSYYRCKVRVIVISWNHEIRFLASSLWLTKKQKLSEWIRDQKKS